MKKKDFENLVDSIREAGRIRRGEAKPSRVHEFAPVDIAAIRRRLQKSQAEFARMIGVSVATLQNWEQGRGNRKDRHAPSSRSRHPTPKPWRRRSRAEERDPESRLY